MLHYDLFTKQCHTNLLFTTNGFELGMGLSVGSDYMGRQKKMEIHKIKVYRRIEFLGLTC